MKKSLLLLVTILSTLISKAQDLEEKQDFELGVIGGFGFSNVVGADVVGDNGLRLGLHLGGFAELDFDEKFGFRPEVHIISVKGTSSGGFRMLYFDFPLMGTYDLDEKFSLLAGFQPSFLLHAKVDDGRGNITGDIRTIDFGVVLGAWYKIDDVWSVGGRFSHGILRVGADGNEKTYNVNFQLSVGYQIF